MKKNTEKLMSLLKEMDLVPHSGFGDLNIRFQNGEIYLFEKKEQLRPKEKKDDTDKRS